MEKGDTVKIKAGFNRGLQAEITEVHTNGVGMVPMYFVKLQDGRNVGPLVRQDLELLQSPLQFGTRYIVVSGNPTNGFEYSGIFGDPEEAEIWAKRTFNNCNTYWIAKLLNID